MGGFKRLQWDQGSGWSNNGALGAVITVIHQHLLYPLLLDSYPPPPSRAGDHTVCWSYW